MHPSAVFTLAVAGLAAAQSTSSVLPVSGCGNSIDLIIQNCLGTTQAQYNACKANDWSCLCEQSNNVLVCYNNCPSAPQRFGFEQTKVANCNAASAYPSSSSTASAGTLTATTSHVSATATTNPTSTINNETSGTRTTAATASATKDSGAATVAVPAGLAAIFGVLAFL